MNEIDYGEISTKFECVQIAMTKGKEGFVLKLAINPADAPEDMLRDPVGQRYLAVLVRLNDQDEPVASKEKEEGDRAVRLAATLCSDEGFQSWLAETGQIDEMADHAAAVWMRKRLGITSRKELKTDKEARQKLLSVRDEFIQYKRRA